MNVLQLRDANVEADQFWDTFMNMTTELAEDEESEGTIKITRHNMDYSDGITKTLFGFCSGFLDDSQAVYDTPLGYQLYKHVESTKELGVSETEACAFLGQSKLNGRALVRNLVRTSMLDFYATNQGRQTVRR